LPQAKEAKEATDLVMMKQAAACMARQKKVFLMGRQSGGPSAYWLLSPPFLPRMLQRSQEIHHVPLFCRIEV
ncbi:MAG: hypothetical protein ACKPJD_22575, partial [Planctomycetaceae bacterium]